MEITIMDYNSEKTTIELGPIEDVAVAFIRVLTGDEVLTVVKKDGTYSTYDSSSFRMDDFYDDEYTVIRNGEFLVGPSWFDRTDSYWYDWDNAEEEDV